MPWRRTPTLENSRQTTLWEFCDLGIDQPREVILREWQESNDKVMGFGDYSEDEEF
jgi:hypothetical protein